MGLMKTNRTKQIHNIIFIVSSNYFLIPFLMLNGLICIYYKIRFIVKTKIIQTRYQNIFFWHQ